MVARKLPLVWGWSHCLQRHCGIQCLSCIRWFSREPCANVKDHLIPRRLILECEQNEAKYEKTLAGALQQASLEKRLEGHTLVPCDQMINTGGHFAGAMLGDNGEHIKLSRREQKIIMNIRKERQPYPTEDDDESESRQSRGQKRGRDEDSWLYRRQTPALKNTEL